MNSLKVGSMRARNPSIWRVAVLLLAVAGCKESPTGPTVGTVRVTLSTTGGDLDLDGYILVLDANPGQTVSVSGTRSFSELAPGLHTVELGGVADNCMVSPSVREVTVTAGVLEEVRFNVSCVATGVEITAAASGIDLDPSYTVAVDGVFSWYVSAGESTSVTRLNAGSHTIALGDIAPNCVADGPNPRSVVVDAGSVVPVTFPVSCLAVTGSVAVTAMTSGSDRDPTGFTVRVDAGPTRALASNGVVTIEQLAAGEHSIHLDGVAANCSIAGDNPRSLQVTAGGATRDTARTTFQVSCVRSTLWQIAFTRNGSVAVAAGDGSGVEIFTSGVNPAWSPNGETLAYSCGASLCLINFDGTGIVQLTNGPTYDNGPAWRPDGAKIAYLSFLDADWDFFKVSVINPDGSGRSEIVLPDGVLYANDLAWSPDGAQLGFSCVIDPGNLDICLIRVDGTGFRRLTTDPGEDGGPEWKPDGTKLAFYTSRYGPVEVALMEPDGSGVTRVTAGTGGIDPAWSPDGLRILFTGLACTFSGCTSTGLFVMNPDGTGLTRLTTQRDYAPDWR